MKKRKPSQLPKDDRAQVRINADIKRALKTMGITSQNIIDKFIDSNIKFEGSLIIRPKLKDM